MNLRAESRELRDAGAADFAPQRLDSSFAAGEFERLLGDEELAAAAAEVREKLRHPLFQRREGLSTAQTEKLAYQRARLLARALEIRSDELRGNPTRLFAVHEWLGLVDGVATTVFSIHYCLALGSILELGQGREELSPWVSELERMDSVGVFLATELGYGNNVAALETRATYDPEAQEFVLESPTRRSLKFMPNTAFEAPKVAVVMARLSSLGVDCGVFPFIVRLRDDQGAACPSIRIAALSEKPGYALDNGVTYFGGVRIPKQQLLSGVASVLHADGRFESRTPSRRGRFLASMARVQVGRVCFTSAVVAVLRAATWIALRYAAQRLTFAPGSGSVAIVRYRNVQRDLFGALASAYALTFAMRRVQREYRDREHRDQDELFRVIAAVKAVASSEVSLELQRLRERCGAAGMLSANRIIDYWNQVQGVITAEGDNQLMLLKVGRQLWEASPRAASKWVRLRDLRSATARELLSLFQFREAGSAEELRASVSKARARTRSGFSIWNDHVNATMAAATSYALSVIAQSFCAAIEDARGQEVSAALTELFRLWCLEQLERSAGWFLARGCLEPEMVIGLACARDEQCARVERYAEALADAFGFDNAILEAPIADQDYTQRYEAFFRTEDEA